MFGVVTPSTTAWRNSYWAFNSTGTRAFWVYSAESLMMQSYTLSTAWDVTTATYDNKILTILLIFLEN